MLRLVSLFCPCTKMSKIYKCSIVFIAQTLPLLYRYLNWKRPEIQIIVTTCGDVWIRKHLCLTAIISKDLINSLTCAVSVIMLACVVGLELVVCFVHALHVFSIPAQMCGAYLAFILSSTVRVTCFFLCSFSLFCHSAMCIRNLSTMCLPMGHERN